MYAIEAKDLTKSFNGVKAVDDVSLQVDEGDVVALLGPNGAGKTTTLMMLLGVTEPDAGSVSLLGHPLPRGRTAALESTNFTGSYVGLPYRMKVREFMGVCADIYGARPGKVREVCELFGIADLLDRMTTHLSSGQKTLIGLAKSMLNEPRLLILDEPTASLDPQVANHVRDVFHTAQKQEGFTVLVTSHNMADIERLCRRVIFIARGKIVADGTPADIAARYGASDLEGTFLSIASQERL
ncbi:MAG: ABC transporter ATP-binding protein [Actinomycetota bacterium]